MRKGISRLVFSMIIVLATSIFAVTSEQAKIFAGQNLNLCGSDLTMHSSGEGKHILLYKGQFSLTMGANSFSSDNAVVWISKFADELGSSSNSDYRVKVFLEGNVTIKRGLVAKATDIRETVIDRGQSLMTGMVVSGEIFATAVQRREADVSDDAVYKRAKSYLMPVRIANKVSKDALVPDKAEIEAELSKDVADLPEEDEESVFSWFVPKSLIEGTPQEEPEPVQEEDIKYEYPVNIAGVWEPSPRIEKTTMADGTSVATVIGRFYLWQKLNDEGDMVEFQADNAVIFYEGEGFNVGTEETGNEELLASGDVKAVYFDGNIVLTEGRRTVQADEMYYDFKCRQALVINAEMRTYDPKRGVPVYLRAEKLMQVCENLYQADNVLLTSDEFYMPQMSATVSSMIVMDTQSLESRSEELKKGRYDAVMQDVRLKVGKATVFAWPKIRRKLERPDLPIKKIHVAQDSSFGTGVETDWYLCKLLGIEEKPGVDSTLSVDYYSKRGAGGGVDVEYGNDDYFGEVLGYVIQDRGEDRLGRSDSRKDLEPDNDLRGRAMLRHRQYLPYGWQLTLEAGYLSDENFLESFYRSEYNNGKDQETLIHLKRLKNNWAFSWLANVRINDFQDQLEELPTAQFHMVGQDLFNGLVTYYTHNTLGRMRQRYAEGTTTKLYGASEDFFTYGSSRHELDMPFNWGNTKIVPFVAGTVALEDGDGFTTGLNGQAVEAENNIWLGEAGLRASTMFWKTDQYVKSRLWDLNGLRHTIRPHLEFSIYQESDDAVEMRDTLNFGISQRWQTRRGCAENLETVDWMKFDVNATWVKDSGNDTIGPNEFIFNDPSIPLFERRYTDAYGVRRNSVDAEYSWEISDTYTILSDMNYDMQSGEVQQFDVGVSRYCWPNLSWYLGTRYLKRVVASSVFDNYYEEGSNSLNFGITYQLSPRYTLLFSQEYDFDYGKNVRSEIAVVRRYHRVYYGITISTDESLDRDGIVFSIWPEGVKELGIGSRKYYGLTQSSYYD